MVDLNYKIRMKLETIYYKYVVFNQPILTANGTMGGDSFACDQSAYFTESTGVKRQAWQVFDDYNNQDTRWQINSINLNNWYDIYWYNPTPIYISSLEIRNCQGMYSILSYTLYGSNDNSTWQEIITGSNDNAVTFGVWGINISSENISPYTYFKLSCKGRDITALQVRNIKINGYTDIIESTSSDYDFSEQKIIPKAICENTNSTYVGIIQQGNIIRHNNILSGFSNNSLVNYAKFKEPFNPVGNDFEICMGFKTADNVATGNNQTIFNSNGATNNEYRGIILHLGGNGKLVIGSTNSDNSGWITSIYGPVAAINTKYWLKAVRDNGYLKGYYSTDNENWTLIDTKTLDFNYTPFTQSYLGNRYQPATVVNKLYDYFHGEIDLSTSYIKINGSYWWSGAKANAKMFYV